MSGPGLSVALATWNGQAFLQAQLDSLARQSRLPDELVVTDDGSTDATVAIAQRFAQSAPFPVRVLANETRLGYAGNFLKAAALCRGELIAFCDQDDVWQPDKLQRMEQALRAEGALLACHDATLVDAALAPLGRILRHPRVSPFDIVPGCAIVVRRELIEIPVERRHDPRLRDAEGEWNGLPHDRWLWFLASALDGVRRVARPLVLYRQHDRNVFGAGAPPQRLASLTPAAGRSYAVQAGRAARWSEFLAELAGDAATPQRWRAAIADGSARCRLLSSLLATRAGLYEASAGVASRAASFVSMLAAGAYRAGRFGRAALLKDAAVTVVGARLRKA